MLALRFSAEGWLSRVAPKQASADLGRQIVGQACCLDIARGDQVLGVHNHFEDASMVFRRTHYLEPTWRETWSCT